MTQLAQAIVLRAIPFQDRHQIITLFSSDFGLHQLFSPFSLSKKSAFFGCFSPLHHVEVSWEQAQKDLPKLKEAFLLSSQHHLRSSFDALQAGCKLIKALLDSQLPNKPAPLLYQLLLSYIDLLPHCCCAEILVCSFKLKILRHEGLLEALETAFDEEEASLIQVLALTLSSNILKELHIPTMLANKIDYLFHERIAL